MLAIVTFIIGAILGWVRATRRNGTLADKIQYTVGYAIALGLLGLTIGMIMALTGLFPGA